MPSKRCNTNERNTIDFVIFAAAEGFHEVCSAKGSHEGYECSKVGESCSGNTYRDHSTILKDITKSLQVYSDFDDLSHVQGLLHNAQSVIQTVKIKRHDVEAALLNEKKRLEDELDTERKLYVSSGTALRQQLDLARDETLTLKTTVADLELQKRTLEGKCTLLREEQAEDKRKLEQAEMTCNSLQDETNILETDILTLRGERDRLQNDHVVIQTELERERKKTLCQWTELSPVSGSRSFCHQCGALGFPMEDTDITEERTESLQIESDLKDDLWYVLSDARARIKRMKMKRLSPEAAIAEEKAALKAELDKERELRNSSPVELRDEIITLQRERNAALFDAQE
ncbi:unnamed protein product [Calypogeia fissa]